MSLLLLLRNKNQTIRLQAEGGSFTLAGKGDRKRVICAVSTDGGSTHAQTSEDGVTWTLRNTLEDVQFSSITHDGVGRFAAVAKTGPHRVYSSVDGINWGPGTGIIQTWTSIAYAPIGDGIWVAVSSDGTTQQVMTSTDLWNWIPRDTPATRAWSAIIYSQALHLFVAVASSGGIGSVMTSPDGITWTQRFPPSNHQWTSIAYGNGKFVVVSKYTGAEASVIMTSSDAITWSMVSVTTDFLRNWNSVTFGNGKFVAVTSDEGAASVMTSLDGVSWTLQLGTPTNLWSSVCYTVVDTPDYSGPLFVAVSAGEPIVIDPGTNLVDDLGNLLIDDLGNELVT